MATITKPISVTDLDLAFGPRRCYDLMPDYATIPDTFKSLHNPYVKLFEKMFYRGLEKGDVAALKPKDDIDAKEAFRHIRAICGSFEPKHEHKGAACAYLFSLWFDIDPDSLQTALIEKAMKS